MRFWAGHCLLVPAPWQEKICFESEDGFSSFSIFGDLQGSLGIIGDQLISLTVGIEVARPLSPSLDILIVFAVAELWCAVTQTLLRINLLKYAVSPLAILQLQTVCRAEAALPEVEDTWRNEEVSKRTSRALLIACAKAACATQDEAKHAWQPCKSASSWLQALVRHQILMKRR